MNRDKGALYPAFAEQLRAFEALLDDQKLPFYLFMGLRTFKEQDELYRQGRTKPGAVVTNSPGGYSWHNYGLAADYVLDIDGEKPGPQWSWQLKTDVNLDGRDDWLQMVELAEAVELECGLRWKSFPDAPHVQNRYGLELAEARELFKRGGLAAVWSACG